MAAMIQGVRVLVVEDEPNLARNLKRGLIEAGFETESAGSAEDAESILAKDVPDVIVLDLRLPGKDGLTFLRQFRAWGNATPVLVLTARGSVEDRVSGLDAGADDYLPKPFAFTELVARVKALARRKMAANSSILRAANLELDTMKRRVWRSGHELNLSPKETILLELLMRYAGQVVTRDMIAKVVWGSGYNDFTNLIEVFVNRLRQKIDSAGEESLITTVRGVGYSIRAT